MAEKRKGEIKLTITEWGKKGLAITMLTTMASGLGAYFNGAMKEYKSGKIGQLSQTNEKRIIKIEAKSRENEKNLDRVYQKLDSLDRGQRQIIFLLRK